MTGSDLTANQAASFADWPARLPRQVIAHAGGPMGLPPVRLERFEGYEILGVLDEDDRSIVYEAEPRESEREHVAIRMMKRRVESPEMRARLLADGQRLTSIRHDGLAEIHEIGFTSGAEPFLVTEMTSGEPITSYCELLMLRERERLGLFLEVCHAVQHVHHKGVVHGGLRPDRILIDMRDAFPRIKIVDLGVDALPSGDETPNHEIDALGDVRDLGAVLEQIARRRTEPPAFEIPSDAPAPVVEPGKRSSLAGGLIIWMTRISCAMQNVFRWIGTRLDRLSREFSDDLGSIIGKATEADPEVRYAGASELALDLRHYLRHEPTIAHPHTWTYRGFKLFDRHRVIMPAFALGLMLLLAAAISSGIRLARVSRSEHDTQERLEHTRREAQADKDVLAFLEDDLLAMAAPGRVGAPLSVGQMLDAAGLRIQDRFKDEPLVEARIRSALARTYLRLGRHEAARPHAQWASQTCERVLGPDAEPSIEAMVLVAEVYAHIDELARAEQLFGRAAARRSARVGSEDRLVLELLERQANALAELGRLGEAQMLHRSVLTQRRTSLGEHDPDTHISMIHLGEVLRQTGALEEAESLTRQAMIGQRERLGVDAPATLVSAESLGRILVERGRFDEARELYRQTIGLVRKHDDLGRPTLARLLPDLAQVELRRGKPQAAVALLREALDLRMEQHGATDAHTLEVVAQLAGAAGATGDGESEIRILSGLYDNIAPLPGGAEARARARIASSLASLFEDVGRDAEAKIWRERAQRIAQVLGD